MSNNTIINASNIPINEQTGSIPNVGGALLDWFQQMTFTLVTKTTQAFQVIETATNINFLGIIQPLTGRQLALKPEGERRWNWISVHAQCADNNAIVNLKPDDVIIYLTKQYRIMLSKNYANYGYIYYELVEDYTGSGPT